jgi:hypothetical protein
MSGFPTKQAHTFHGPVGAGAHATYLPPPHHQIPAPPHHRNTSSQHTHRNTSSQHTHRPRQIPPSPHAHQSPTQATTCQHAGQHAGQHSHHTLNIDKQTCMSPPHAVIHVGICRNPSPHGGARQCSATPHLHPPTTADHISTRHRTHTHQLASTARQHTVPRGNMRWGPA